jgi:hypothetical protein
MPLEDRRSLGHTSLLVIASMSGAAFAGGLVIWLNSRPDATLARWSAIATVVAAVAAGLTLVLAVLSWRGGAASPSASRTPGAEGQGHVIQRGADVNTGIINQLGHGLQINHPHPPDKA